MILKDYRCNKCDKTFEDVHTEDQPASCPDCKSTDVTECIGGFGAYGIKGDNSASVTPRHSGFFKRK